MKKLALLIFVLLVLTGCAKPPHEVHPTLVSSEKYESYNCDKLIKERDLLLPIYNSLLQNQGYEAKSDKFSAIIFPPALLIPGKNDEAELARVKGEFNAIIYKIKEKECFDEWGERK
jgi:hypothetical protein